MFLRWFLDIPDQTTTIARRGFKCSDSEVRYLFEEIGRTFVAGYRVAITTRAHAGVAELLNRHPPHLKGFAYEGAAMGFALLDGLIPSRSSRVTAFIYGPGAPHIYMGHIGAGWALARLPFGHRRVLRQLEPLLHPLAFDGFGFYQGYFGDPADFYRQV